MNQQPEQGLAANPAIEHRSYQAVGPRSRSIFQIVVAAAAAIGSVAALGAIMAPETFAGWGIDAAPAYLALFAAVAAGVLAFSATRGNARLRGATVFCAPSLGGESFGVVLLEAMAAETPVVASAITGYDNVARADRDALLVPPGDAGALRAALQRVLDDPALRDRLIASGRERAREFSMSRLAERYLELYERSLVRA